MFKKFDYLIMAGFFSNLFYSISYPVIHLLCMKNINSNLVALSQLISCICSIFVTNLWLKRSEKMYKKTFRISLIFEAILYGFILLCLYLDIITPAIFFMADCLITSIITRNIINGGTRLKAIRYRDEAREIYDNKNMVLCNVSSIIGYGLSVVFTFPIALVLLFMFLGMVIDNMFYWFAYKETDNNY